MKTELSRVAGQAGMTYDDARIRSLVSLVQERLTVLGEFPFQYARGKIVSYGGLLSLPTAYEAAVHLNLNGVPTDLRSQWFEFLEWGPGSIPQTEWSNLAIDSGESPVYRQPGSDGGLLRIVSTDGDDDSVVKVTGYDKDGVFQRAEFTLPEDTSDIEWSRISWVKKSVTAGDVVVELTDINGAQFNIAHYRPQDINPSFRQYRIPGVGETTLSTHELVLRRRLYPILGDEDELFISNLPALRLGIIGIGLEDKGDIAGAASTFGLATKVLTEEAAKYRPQTKANVQVNVSRVSSLGGRPDVY